MNVIRFKLEQLRIRSCRNDTAKAKIEIDSVLRWGGRNVHPSSAALSCVLSRLHEKFAPQTPISISVAYVEKQELKHIVVVADKTTFKYCDANHRLTVEQTPEPAAPIKTGLEYRGAAFWNALGPTFGIMTFRFERQTLTDEYIHGFNQLTTVDLPDALNVGSG